MKITSQKMALCRALLDGEVVSILTAFRKFGVTNAPREISRQIEQPFDVQVSRVRKESKTRYGTPCNYVEYHLDRTKYNIPGIKKMMAYIKKTA